MCLQLRLQATDLSWKRMDIPPACIECRPLQGLNETDCPRSPGQAVMKSRGRQPPLPVAAIASAAARMGEGIGTGWLVTRSTKTWCM